MGAGGGVRQGLKIKTLEVIFTPAMAKGSKKLLATGTLVRTTEIALAGDPAFPEAGALAMRKFGLKIGMRFRNNHTVKSVKWASGNVLPAPGAFTKATKSPAITTLCENVFGSAGQWFGFKIKGADIKPPASPVPPPLPYPVVDDRLYFLITVEGFHPHHPMDFHEVPAVAVLDSFPDFTQHYVLGMGLFTIGSASNSLQFDTEVVGS
jgi:hypothetical protein